MKTPSVRTSIDLPRELHQKLREAAARKGVSARKMILASIERSIEQVPTSRPQRRLKLDPPLIRPAGRRLRVTEKDIYALIELP